MQRVPFVKPFKSIEHQARSLKLRGLQGNDEDIISRLISVGYDRLSAYWYPFREMNPDGSRSDRITGGTPIEQIWDYSIFDRKLRLLFLDDMERVEVALRCRLAYDYSAQFGPFGYLEHVTCSRLKQKQIDDFVDKMT